MKKYISIILAICMFVGTTAFAISDTDIAEFENSKSAEYSEFVKIETTNGGDNIIISVGGKKITFPDAQPFIENDQLIAPVRFVAEAIGAEVYWFDDIKTVTIIGEQDICMSIGDKQYGVNQKTITLDVAPTIIDERTYAPFQFVAEALGLTVEWIK